MKFIIFILCSTFWPHHIYSQSFNKVYYGVPSDSLYDSPNLIFKKDSIVELSSVPRHMSRQLRMTFVYHKKDNQIFIRPKKLSQADSNFLTDYHFRQFINSYSLVIDNKCLIDEENNLIYALQKDFDKGLILTWFIDGKEYRENMGTSDAYGLIKLKPKKNKSLHRKLTAINDIDEYDLKVYKGLEAYKKFGYKYIPGVYVLTKKKANLQATRVLQNTSDRMSP